MYINKPAAASSSRSMAAALGLWCSVVRLLVCALRHALSVLFALAACLVWPAAAQAQTFMNFTGPPTLVSGTALQQGAQYRYAAVLPGIDALVTLAQFATTTTAITNLDDNTTFAQRFQPVITCADPAANRSCYIRFDFQFVQTGTSTPAQVYGLAVSAQDVDGNGVANGVREFVEFTGANSVTLGTATTTLAAGTPLIGGVRYIQTSATDVQAGIGTGNQYEVYAHYTAAITGFSVLGGNVIGAAGCVSTTTACQRQNSYTFIPADSNVPSVTIRKVSNGGTGTFTFTGNNGWATQPVSTTASGATVTSQSEALLNPNIATTITEAAPAGFTLVSINCTGVGTGSATYTVNGTAGGSAALNAAATAFNNNIVCTFVNRKLAANLSITKTDGTTTIAAGRTITYTITAANSGADPANGAVVQDPAVPGLNCTAVTCAASPTAACPAGVTVAQLQAGVVIPTLPSGSSVSFSLTCGVTATGQ
jgi:uncharacterized repeat protein (TIGR01451 family)